MMKKLSGKLVNQGNYKAFIPDALPPQISWDLPLVNALSEADRLLGNLAGEGSKLLNPHILIRPFIAREAVLSSRIEGTQASLSFDDDLFFIVFVYSICIYLTYC